MTHTPELKPCPFCGGEAEMQLGKAGQAAAFSDRFKVECVSCEATIGWWHDSEADAIAAWNTRAEAGVVRELVAELKALRKRFHNACEQAGNPPDIVAGSTSRADALIAKAGAA